MVFLLPRKDTNGEKMNKLFQMSEPPYPTKTYSGLRFEDGSRRGKCIVMSNDNPLYSILADEEDYTHLYEWGYRGFYARNLTYSILCDYLETSEFPDELAFMFHTYFTARLPFEGWILDSNTIDAWMDYISQEYLQ